MDSQLSGICLQGRDHMVRDPEGQNLCRFNRLVAGAQNSNRPCRRPVSNQDSVPQWNVKPALNAPDASSIPSQSWACEIDFIPDESIFKEIDIQPFGGSDECSNRSSSNLVSLRVLRSHRLPEAC